MTVELKLITGGRGLSGTGFYAPLATVYNPDGQIIFAFDSARRSNRGELTFAADGAYHIVVGADDRGRGVDAYTITIEGDAPQPTPIPTLPPPAFAVEREGAVAKGADSFLAKMPATKSKASTIATAGASTASPGRRCT